MRQGTERGVVGPGAGAQQRRGRAFGSTAGGSGGATARAGGCRSARGACRGRGRGGSTRWGRRCTAGPGRGRCLRGTGGARRGGAVGGPGSAGAILPARFLCCFAIDGSRGRQGHELTGGESRADWGAHRAGRSRSSCRSSRRGPGGPANARVAVSTELVKDGKVRRSPAGAEGPRSPSNAPDRRALRTRSTCSSKHSSLPRGNVGTVSKGLPAAVRSNVGA